MNDEQYKRLLKEIGLLHKETLVLFLMLLAVLIRGC